MRSGVALGLCRDKCGTRLRRTCWRTGRTCGPVSAALRRGKQIQDLLGHEDITTTEIYLHVATGANGLGVVSPLDEMAGRV